LSRGASSAVLAPADDAALESPADIDHRLVAAVRQGNDRAFEALYERYQRRIHAYVLGMVKDHGRAEDVTQEVFVSALRRMRATDRPIAFKPWIYEIAKNACIDAFRRSRRTEEISYDAEEGLAPGDQSRLVGAGPTPDAAVAAKQDLQNLCGAFGGLSEAHHRILVLRELEGLTYEQIGARMGMTRPAVESTLFRARRRLTEEYDELVSGARCARVQSIIASAVAGAVGVRDSRRLSRHLSHCQSCRREALAAGLDRGLLVRRPLAERVAGKLAGLLPLPALERFRRGGDVPAPTGSRVAAHLPILSDQLAGGWGKVATGAALLLAGVGAGVGAHEAAKAPAQHPSRPATSAARPLTQSSPPARTPAGTGVTVTAPATSSRSRGALGDGAAGSVHPRTTSAGSGTGSGTAAGRATPGGAPSGSASTPRRTAAADSAPAKTGGGGGKPSAKLPKAGLPATTADPVNQVADAVDKTSGTVNGAVDQAADTVNSTVQGATGAVQGAVDQATGAAQQATGGGPAAGAVGGATGAANGAVDGVKKTADETTGAVTGAATQASDGLLGGG
jgi:RNA polymerase sigma factor (sigma-70 family)